MSNEPSGNVSTVKCNLFRSNSPWLRMRINEKMSSLNFLNSLGEIVHLK